MIKSYFTRSIGIFTLLLLVTFSACKKDTPMPQAPPPASSGDIDYNLLTSDTPYNNEWFFNSGKDSTVDRTEGHVRLRMLLEMDKYMKTVNGESPSTLSAEKLDNMFANVGNPFGNPSLDTSDLDIRSATGSSRQFFEAEEIRAYFSRNFIEIAQASQSRDQIAEKGKAGKLSTPSSAYLVDANGIEIGQVISKSFIGAFQLDYISNILLDRGLNDDNTNLVADKKYTKLQHNWDVAYGVLTTKPIYGGGATAPGVLPATHNKEAFLGSYVWEYNRENFSGVHVAFLKGRAAAINKDVATMNEQALFIRKQLEITMAKAALGYLNKWRSGTDATKAHAIAEGIGFIYSLRFCELYGANEAFSERVLVELLGTPHNYWDLTADKIANAEKAIKAQFRL